MRPAELVRRSAVRIPAVAVVGLLAGIVLAQALPDYYVVLATGAVVAAISLLGLGVVTGSAGMIALCQLAFATIGAWVVSGLNYIKAPGDPALWLIAGGLVSGVIGIIVGLPALRLRGVNLAVVTLGFAAAVYVAVTQIQFPGTTDFIMVNKPALFSDDQSFFVFAVIVLVICSVIVAILQRSRIGSGWRSVAFSERATASVGASVRLTKLSAFAVSATLAGISGGLVTEQVGVATPDSFSVPQSLAFYVLAIISGSYLVDMAIFGGLMWVAIPEILRQLGIPQDWGFVIFGALGIQSLTTDTNLGEQIRKATARRRSGKSAVSSSLAEAAAVEADQDAVEDPVYGPVILGVSNLSVTFGTVKAVSEVSFEVREGEIMGLIGPNGAGKSTTIDALSGFLPQHTGTITIDGVESGSATPARLARRGLRRTFQQDRVPPTLTVNEYVRFVARRRLQQSDIDEVLEFFGCPSGSTKLANVDVGARRLVEIAAHLASRPRLLLLDEPAAGLSHDEHLALGERLRRVPARFGAAVLLVEHDLNLVRTVCHNITVLDFGEVLASGDQVEVLANPAVLKAYMGETEMLS